MLLITLNDLLVHSALLLTSSGQIEVTNWAIGSNDTNHIHLKYIEFKEIIKIIEYKII